MSNLITQARERKGIPSNDTLAKLVIEAHPELPSLKPRSLSAKSGLLDKGQTGWWKTRPQLAEALASVLAIEVADLGMHVEGSNQALEFPEFPEFPPVDLALEELPPLGKTRRVNGIKTEKFTDSDDIDEWLPSQLKPPHARVIPPRGITWLEISDEFCTRMLIAQLQAKCKWDVLHVEDLTFVSTRLRLPVPIVLHIRRQLKGEELLPLRTLHEHGAVLIIASFPPPQRPKSRWGDDEACWEAVHSSKDERAILNLTSRRSLWGGIAHFAWQLSDDWQLRLLTWIGERIIRLGLDSLLLVEEIQDWLKSFDAKGVLFRHVSDVLMLAQLCHHRGGKTLPKSSHLDAGARLLEKFRPPLNSRDSDILKQLVRARWADMDSHWNGALSWEAWRHLTMSNGCQSTPSMLTIAELQIAVEACILRVNANGFFEFVAPLRASLLARDIVKDAIANGQVDLWGAVVFDEARRQLVDTVVDTLTTVELASAVDKLDISDPWSPASIGAEETLFLALSRAAWAGDLEQSTVERIVKAVWARGGTSEQLDIPRLWSRHNSYSDTLGEWRWMQNCWYWSMGTQRPASLEIGEWAAGYFPGWAETPTWPPSIPARDKDQEEGSPSAEWKEFMRLAADLADKFSPPELLAGSEMESNDPLFALALSWEGQWAPRAEWWKNVIQKQWAEELLLHTVSVHGKDTAAWLWPSLIEALSNGIAGAGSFLILCRSSVWQWIMSTLTAEALVENRSDLEIAFLCRQASHLPPSLRAHLLETLPIEWGYKADSEIGILMEWCPEQRCDVLLRWQESILLIYRIANKIWEASPQYALALLDEEQLLNNYAAQALIDCVPAEHIAEIASLLCKRPDLLDSEQRICWVKGHLSASGQKASQILSVIRTESVSDAD
jgi:hypothetical protein